MPIKDEFKEYFKILTWPGLVIDDNEISWVNGKILTFQNSEYTLNFFWYNQRNREHGIKPRQIIFDESFDIRSILYLTEYKYDISYYRLFKSVCGINEDIKIKINSKTSGIIMSRGALSISHEKIVEIVSELTIANKEIKSHSNSFELYLTNKIHNKFFRKQIQSTTTIKQGTLQYIIDRFNLPTKKSKKDYLKHLNSEDINSLQIFTEHLIKNEIFSEEFLRILDEYFIKEKLQNIISLGKKILSLKSTRLNTVDAKAVIKKISVATETIKQFENIWQKFFEKNLLYLVFSYKKIYPKIELDDVEGDKKYPDFIGINHYNGVDVIEIKTHLTNILTWDSSHKNFAFSNAMSKAIIQTMNYLDAIVQRRFKDPENKQKITNFTDEENLYHPRGIIVISSYNNLTNARLDSNKRKKLNRDFTKLRNSLQNIEILTFDEVLQIADDYIKNIRTEQDNSN